MRTGIRRFWWVPVVLIGIAIGVLLVERSTTPDPRPPGVSSDLRSAPWAQQPDGSPALDDAAARPSLLFPAGVTYGQALRLLVQSARQDGRMPSAATLADPLPPEVVVVRPDGPGEGLRLSLLAPFGWTPDTRVIRPASYRFPSGVDIRQATTRLREIARPGTPLPPDIAVDVPRLEPCQIAIGTPDRRPSCP